MTEIGTYIRGMRETQGLTQEALGRKVGVTGAFISAIETGKKVPSSDVCEDLAAALDVDLTKLLYRRRQDKKPDQNPPSQQEPEPEEADQESEDDGDAEGEPPPWEREDGWERRERQTGRGLGVRQVTIRNDGGIYLSSDLAEATGLSAGQRVRVFLSGDRGGLQAHEDGDYRLSAESDSSGLKLSTVHFQCWVDDESRRADVQEYGDGWVAFGRPEGAGQ